MDKIWEESGRTLSTYQDANADDGIDICKVARDRILRCIEHCDGERAYQDGHIDIRYPG
jgi:hypothetical protein